MATSETKIETPARPTQSDIVQWCRDYVSRILDVPVDKINAAAEFESFGLDSAVAVALVAEIGDWMGVDVEPAELFEYPTIESFAEHLCQR